MSAAYEKITNQIIEALEAGHIPWEKPWNTLGSAPQSVHGKRYRGFNAIWLDFVQNRQGYKDCRWITYNQAKKQGGQVSHFFSNISVAVVKLKTGLKKGDKILIEGAHTSFEQKVGSMQVEHEKIETAKKGQAIGLKVKDRVREGDKVFLAG